MKPKILNKWVTALRSGEYKKCIGALKKKRGGEVKHCGLGVLCELYSKETGVPWNDLNAGETEFSIYNEYLSLPSEVCKWAGLNSDNPEICESGDSVTELNDNKRKSFPAIADMLVSAQIKKLI